MFDPKITEGKWEINYWKTELGTEFCSFEDENGELIRWGRCHTIAKPEYIENGKAIAAVPELLEVYRETLKFIDVVNKVCFRPDVLNGRSDILDARTKILSVIKILEKKEPTFPERPQSEVV